MFKEQMAKDLERVFHNGKEFAENKMVFYNNEEHEISCILDYDIAEQREKPVKDNSYGIYNQKLKAYIYNSGITFRHGSKIEIDDENYTITGIAIEMGETILDLERYDE